MCRFTCIEAMTKKLGDLVCKWTGCSSKDVEFGSTEDLSRHVDECHLDPCAQDDLFFCLWEGCKVYNKPSYSYGWLKRHTKEKHTKERPNKCLMNGCHMAFNTIDALQRHMLRHFQTSPPPAVKNVQSAISTPPLTPPQSREGVEEGGTSDIGSMSPSSSLVRGTQRSKKRYSLKVRIPRHSLHYSSHSQGGPVAFNGAHFHGEVLDRKTMSVIKQTANMLAMNDCQSSTPATNITITAQVVGRRSRAGEEPELLVRWKPRLIADCWVPLRQYKEERVVSLAELSTGQLASIADSCFTGRRSNRKNKRKPDN